MWDGTATIIALSSVEMNATMQIWNSVERSSLSHITSNVYKGTPNGRQKLMKWELLITELVAVNYSVQLKRTRHSSKYIATGSLPISIYRQCQLGQRVPRLKSPKTANGTVIRFQRRVTFITISLFGLCCWRKFLVTFIPATIFPQSTQIVLLSMKTMGLAILTSVFLDI